MASQIKSVHRQVDRRENRRRLKARPDHEGAEDRLLNRSTFCALCFVTFGSHERRVLEGDEVVHQRCLGRLRRPGVA